MYYRRKYLLALIEGFPDGIGRTSLQKTLFLATRLQEKKSYDFVPYKFGCYSFQANQDLSTMLKREMVDKDNNDNWICKKNHAYIKQLKKEDVVSIKFTLKKYANYTMDDLIKETYVNYPFFATKSEIADKVLSTEELSKVNKQKRVFEDAQFYTIGYEGITLEKYINKLILNDIKLLCDVRKNSFSMKYGFSKKQLSSACEGVGIDFIHIPDLGIESQERKALNTMGDYNRLFKKYEETVLETNQKSLNHLMELCQKYKRVAITCFEKEVCMCHRGRIAKKLNEMPNWNIPQTNL